MGGIILAWLVGEGIITWRSVTKERKPPIPGDLLAATGLFAVLALIAEYQPARGVATLFAFGIDIAVLMQVLPGSNVNAKSAGAAAKAPAAPQAAAK